MKKEKQLSSVCCVHPVEIASVSHFLQSKMCWITKCVTCEFTSLKACCIMNYYAFQIVYSCCAVWLRRNRFGWLTKSHLLVVVWLCSNSVWVTVMKSHLLTVFWLCSNSIWVTVMKSHLMTVVWLCSNRFGWQLWNHICWLLCGWVATVSDCYKITFVDCCVVCHFHYKVFRCRVVEEMMNSPQKDTTEDTRKTLAVKVA